MPRCDAPLLVLKAFCKNNSLFTISFLGCHCHFFFVFSFLFWSVMAMMAGKRSAKSMMSELAEQPVVKAELDDADLDDIFSTTKSLNELSMEARLQAQG